MINQTPLVSCLMVTQARADRARWLRVALDNYCRQTHPLRELVIVLDDPLPADRARLERDVALFGRKDIRILCPSRKLSLGALRNVSVEQARGHYVCLWDDDDVHHPRRIELQLQHLQETGAPAGLIADCLHLFMNAGICFWVNWDRTRFRGLPGTLLARRDLGLRYPEHGPRSTAGEDTDLLERLLASTRVEILRGPPFLYIYRFHGANTWDLDHHAMLAGRFCEPRERLVAEQRAVLTALACLEPGVTELSVSDASGSVFSVRASSVRRRGLTVATEEAPTGEQL